LLANFISIAEIFLTVCFQAQYGFTVGPGGELDSPTPLPAVTPTDVWTTAGGGGGPEGGGINPYTGAPSPGPPPMPHVPAFYVQVSKTVSFHSVLE